MVRTLTLACTVLGAVYAYQKNGGDSGAYFLQRFFALGWVVFVRVLAVLIPIFFGVIFLVTLTTGVGEETQWHDVLFILFGQFFSLSTGSSNW